MLVIDRKFTLSFQPQYKEEISKKLNGLGALVIAEDTFIRDTDGKKEQKVFMDCFCEENKFQTLIKYLQDDFAGMAAIQY